MAHVRKVLEALDFGFSVYGMGEFDPDIETVNVDEAMEHITAQDETMVVLFDDGNAVGTLWIMGDDGDFEIYDWNLPEEIAIVVDRLTKED